MALLCEDLARHGVSLIPASTGEYFELLADIERRLQIRPKGLPPLEDGALSRISEHSTGGSAILQNGAAVAIASISYIWWFRDTNGHIFPHCFLPHCFLPGTNPSVLLPFGLNAENSKRDAFWNSIFPGSKRLMAADGRCYGDNTDVRAPTEDELWHGGFFGLTGGAPNDSLEPVKLTLDGVFFVDGGFAGPNSLGAWEHSVFASEAFLACAALARDAWIKSTPAGDFFIKVQQLTGQTDEMRMPPPPPPAPSLANPPAPPLDVESIRGSELKTAGWRVLSMRKSMGDEAALRSIAAWAIRRRLSCIGFDPRAQACGLP